MIEVEIRGKKKRVKEASDVGSLLNELDLNPDEYVVSVNGKIVLEDEKLKDGDKVKLYPVVSGG